MSCDRFWSLQLMKDVVELEKVWRGVARIIMVIEKLLYEKMLKRMEVFNSENRVMEGEINIYKTIKQWIKWMKNCYSLYHNTGTRGCPSKLFRNQFKRPPRLVTQTLPCTVCSSAWQPTVKEVKRTPYMQSQQQYYKLPWEYCPHVGYCRLRVKYHRALLTD